MEYPFEAGTDEKTQQEKAASIIEKVSSKYVHVLRSCNAFKTQQEKTGTKESGAQLHYQRVLGKHTGSGTETPAATDGSGQQVNGHAAQELV